ncbi:MAG: amidohydrolase family protein [Proteobacteria bacterium]|nr:amidohydrolase family protein [Pseudomonadota bacterium]
MSYAGSRICYDADSHIVELPDWLATYADPDVRERLRPLNLAIAGGKAAEAIERAKARSERREAPLENPIGGPKGWFAPGAFDPGERTRALDALGFRKQLVFSTFALTQFVGSDAELLHGGTRAHNRAIAEFCADDERLVPVGFVPLDDPAATLREASEAIRLGCGAIAVPMAPPRDRSPTHPDHDALWALLQDANVPFMLHIGFGSLRFIPPGFHQNGKAVTDFIGGGENLRAKDFVAIGHAPAIFLGAMALDGVFERFPGLRGGCIELGAAWVVPWLRQIDLAQSMFAKSEPDLALPLRASDYIRRQVKFTPFAGEPVGWMIEQAGEELFLFSSDYPHPEGSRDPIARFEATLGGASDTARERFYARNFQELLPVR